MPAKVEILIQVCVNGRPIWRKAKTIRNEMTLRMTDREYDRVLDAGIRELSAQVHETVAREKKKEPVVAGAK